MKTTVFLMALIVSAGAFAGQGQEQEDGRLNASWERFKRICKNYRSFNYQKAPEKIKITCTRTRTSWKRSSQELQTFNSRLGTKTTYTFELSSTKANVGLRKASERGEARPQLACRAPVFKELKHEVRATRTPTCDQIKDYAGSLAQYCRTAIADELTRDASAESKKETGRYVKTKCSMKQGRIHSQGQEQEPDREDQGQK